MSYIYFPVEVYNFYSRIFKNSIRVKGKVKQGQVQNKSEIGLCEREETHCVGDS